MGKSKIEITKIENEKDRSSKFSKRKPGLVKKVKELTMLCGVDIALLAFSPTFKATFFTTPSSSLNEILDKFVKLPFEVREKRRVDTIEILMKLLSENIQKLSLEGEENLTENGEEYDKENDEEKDEEDDDEEDDDEEGTLELIKRLIARKESNLRNWENPESINDVEQVKIMRDHLSTKMIQLKQLLQI